MKRCKSIMCLLAIASGVFALDHSPEEMGAFVRAELWRIVENAPSDNVGNGDSLANYHDIEPEVWSNYFGSSVYKGWSLNERKAAFDWYLNSICTNDSQRIDGEELVMFRVALGQCRRSSYTNAVPALKELVKNPCGVDKNDALRVIVDCSPISDALTDYIENIMTNKVVYQKEARVESWVRYVTKVRLWGVQNSIQDRIKQRATDMFYRNRFVDFAGTLSMDMLFVSQYAGYEISSNRLQYVNYVMSNPLLKMSPYFIAVTNQLLSSSQPLRWINVGGNE